MNTDATWCKRAEVFLLDERSRARPTPLRELALPALPGRRLVFKDESVHATGSLKHRLARSLFLHAIRSGRLEAGMSVYDASSGNTAVSEAAFAQQLGLRYFAVIPESTTASKQALIRAAGGECLLVAPGRCCKTEAARLAAESGGCFLDQFANAAVATDWRDTLVTELFAQLHERDLPEPDWFVTGAGTGGTATSAGRYFRRTGKDTQLLVVDPEDSAFFEHYRCGASGGCLCASRIEGIGRPTVEPAFDAALVDRMQRVPDAASFAAARWLSQQLGKPVGLSTGTNFIGAISLFKSTASEMIATVICDDGNRYAERLHNSAWLASQGLELSPWMRALDRWHRFGDWRPPSVQFFETSSRTVA